MEKEIIISIAAICLNIITLLIVIYQTMVTRKALTVSEESFNEESKIRKISSLPRAHFIIHVNPKIDCWVDEINELEKHLKVLNLDRNTQDLIDLAKKINLSSQGIVERFYYEKSPDWLAEIYMACAKHYYSIIGKFVGFKEGYHHDTMIEVSKELVSDISIAKYHIYQLKQYIDNIVPSSYLSTPESIREDAYLTK